MAHIQKSYSVGVITVSDSCFHGKKDDLSGSQMANLLMDPDIFPSSKTEVLREIVPDEKQAIKDKLICLTDSLKADLILTVGGTGFSPRDVTPEATEEVCDRKAPSLAHAMTALCFEDSSYALLSRATCGIRDKTIILNLPGSAKGSKECFLKISKILPHAVDLARNDLKAAEMSHNEASLVKPHDASKAVIPTAALRPRESQYPMVSFDEAREIILSQTTTVGVKLVKNAKDLIGHVAVYDVKAKIPSPPFRASVKDGYAVLVSDGLKCRKVLSVSVAGDSPEGVILVPGGCVRVNTGGPVPAAADAVIQVEDTVVSETTDEGDEEFEIIISKEPVPSLDIREIGSDIAEGQIIIPSGKVISAFDCGILASAGVESVYVHCFPCVALLSTGNELVSSRDELKAGCIIDSSKPILREFLREMNVNYCDMGIAQDDPNSIKHFLKEAFQRCDVVVVTGGVSMGEKDFVKEVLIADFSAKFHFGRILMKPGKPTAYATLTYGGIKKHVFCLPGNPVSSVVTFHLYVVPCLRKMMGHRNVTQQVIEASLEDEVILDPRPEYHRAILTWEKGSKPVVHSTGSQLSSRLLSFTDANALMMLPPRTAEVSTLLKGTSVRVLMLNTFTV